MRKIFAILASVLMILSSVPAMAGPHGGWHGGPGWHGGYYGGGWRGNNNGWWIAPAIIGGAIATGIVVNGCWRSWYDQYGVYHRVWIC